LRDLLCDVRLRATRGSLDVEISAVTADSRLVTKDALFVAVPGLRVDGAAFVDQALAKGAAAVVAQTAVTAPVSVEVDDAREALSLIAANFHGRPAEKLLLAGVTGTSGKTTTTRMIESIFDASGEPVGLIGTIEYRAGEERLVADRTTPDAVVLQEWFAKMVATGARYAVMEVSSHALALKRVHGVKFAAAVFTNLSRDHFDFHRDFDDYFAAKKVLFDQIDRSKPCAVVNADDDYGRRLIAELGPAAVTFGRSERAEVRPAEGFSIGVDGLRGTVLTPHGPVRVESELLGLPNLYNWLAAIGAALVVGVDRQTIEAGVRNLRSVRGRFERVAGGGGPTVIVDYAHKPDALEKLLHAVRDIAGERKVTLLFGCGGDRDKGKRPEMGRIAGTLADFTILTSDNPRSEKPEAILDDIERGMTDIDRSRYTRIADRRAAIAKAIAEASDDEVVVIAGKGHETYQVVGDHVVHFDDREEAEIALKKRTKQ
ncbi:MAG TPA: UDP-N-acetylmuramoyl-L-alanyl-D-glutamate--2,6-diaminopimelate ligase, partial [Thermoanaerobaculia bacterium]|nr:UDP-N-acetylmuramoyl-L-alanyl-D-glutamate--2,6-diaminopimelate ligase [Thermoanaerobaculia bacterium]